MVSTSSIFAIALVRLQPPVGPEILARLDRVGKQPDRLDRGGLATGLDLNLAESMALIRTRSQELRTSILVIEVSGLNSAAAPVSARCSVVH